MKTGPQCQRGFDLALTETDAGFVVEVGTSAGQAVVDDLTCRAASGQDLESAAKAQQRARDEIEKQLETERLREDLLENLDDPHGDEVAERCLSCTNCTAVCPTCFCSTVHDVSDLQAQSLERVREWDSCFNLDFSYTASGTVRNDRRSRYRQWLTHKLATWHDQFDASGCVGCGRCIAWCPVGIDLTEEVVQIREKPSSRRRLPGKLEDEPTTCEISTDRSKTPPK